MARAVRNRSIKQFNFMDAKKYMAALSLSTMAALKSGQISLPEIIGCLELTKLNTERTAFQHAMQQHGDKAQIIAASIMPPNLPGNSN